MPYSKFLIAGFLAIALALSFGCSDSADEQSVAQANDAPDNTDGEADDAGGSGSGGATLTIGSESWTFANVHCTLSPQEAGSPSFTMQGSTETADGVRVHLDAVIQDPKGEGRYAGDGVIHIIGIVDSKNLAVGWSSMKGGMFGHTPDTIQVDGKSVTAETTFDNTLTNDVDEKTPGKLEGVCP